MPENSYDLLRLPPQALNLIRRAVAPAAGVHLAGPGGVALYLSGPDQYVLYNMTDGTAAVSLRFDGNLPAEGWKELVHGKALAVTQSKPQGRFPVPPWSDVALTLGSFEIAVVQSPVTKGSR
jgi:hypothetical protein